MKIIIALLLFSASAFAQNSYKIIIKAGDSRRILPGATLKVSGHSLQAIADETGMASLSAVPSGKQTIQLSYPGYQTRTDTVLFPSLSAFPDTVYLKPVEEEELEEVLISATRSSRTIEQIPTRVELIAAEELDEKANMKPGDIRMLLAESTGIQTQQTSATSANSSIRIQGLDGKYTQIIRDGFPLYSGFSGGLGLLQIAPLDLQQVEVIKGSASTLYGGGAIAGLVNLVSKKPTADQQLNFMLNGTSALGLDVTGFYGEKFDKIGLTLYGGYHKGTAYDPSDIGLSAIPNYDRFTLNPKLYLYFNEATTLSAGINLTTEKRTGGDMEFLKGKASPIHSYFEENKTGRYSSQIELIHQLNEREKLVLRNSLAYYDRRITMPNYNFSGTQFSSYTELNYSLQADRADWVAGLNFITDQFTEDRRATNALRSYRYHTIGAFAQNTVTLSEKLSIESGVRGDYHDDFGFFFLPRISALWKISPHLSTRLGGGLGYKAPSIFTEDAERIQFKNVRPIDLNQTKAERSYGANYDLSYRQAWLNDRLVFSINQMFFYTRINRPILLSTHADGDFGYMQPNGNLETKGMETNLRLSFANFKLFSGYTYADVKQQINSASNPYPLVSKHRLNQVLMYEVEDQWKIGAEAYFFSKQKLNDGTTGKSYWTTGLMVEKLWERFSVFINFENFTDTRQTKFDSIYTGSITNPVFRDIYAPVDGFVMNGGIKLKLGSH